MLFAMQYACAKSWMDCGMLPRVAAVLGHRFGEITALCVFGVLSLKDTHKLVAGRARLVRDAWGSDPELMMAIEADGPLVNELLIHANRAYGGSDSAGIACYNSPHGFTLAGSPGSINAVAEMIPTSQKFAHIRSKKLKGSNAFHLSLVDPLCDDLEQIGKALNYSEPLISLERASEMYSNDELNSRFVADHMRSPVHQSSCQTLPIGDLSRGWF